MPQTVTRFCLSLDVDNHSRGEDEWFDAAQWTEAAAIALYAEHHGVRPEDVVVSRDYEG